MTSSNTATPSWRTPTVVLVCGGLILTLAMGIRHGFGLWLQPISADLRLGPRDVRVRARHAEPRVGR